MFYWLIFSLNEKQLYNEIKWGDYKIRFERDIKILNFVGAIDIWKKKQAFSLATNKIVLLKENYN